MMVQRGATKPGQTGTNGSHGERDYEACEKKPDLLFCNHLVLVKYIYDAGKIGL